MSFFSSSYQDKLYHHDISDFIPPKLNKNKYKWWLRSKSFYISNKLLFKGIMNTQRYLLAYNSRFFMYLCLLNIKYLSVYYYSLFYIKIICTVNSNLMLSYLSLSIVFTSFKVTITVKGLVVFGLNHRILNSLLYLLLLFLSF